MINTMKTAFLMSLLVALAILIGYALGGMTGLIIGGAIALVGNLFSYWFSDKIVLATYRAQELSEEEAPKLHAMVERLTQRAGLPKPRVYLVPSQTPNAFATGRSPKHAVIAVTEGCVRTLRDQELEGVLAHEISHVADRDMLIATIAATMAGAIMMVASMMRWGMMMGGMGGRNQRGPNPLVLLAIAIFAPIAAMLIQLAISRSREYEADAQGARLAGSAHGLADALESLERASHRSRLEAAGPSTAHLFIVNPLSAKGLASLFSTHPPIEERVRRLRSMTI